MAQPLPSVASGLLACALLVLAAPAHAQLAGGLPGALPDVGVPLPGAGRLADQVLDAPRDLRDGAIAPVARRLVHRHPDVLAFDPSGAAILRREVVAIDPLDTSLARVRAAGFEVASQRELQPLGLRVVTLRLPARLEAVAALDLLRALDPRGTYDFNHLYFGSAAESIGPAREGHAPLRASAPVRIGLIDGGVDRRHAALRDVDVHAWGCAGRAIPDAHGTAVASLLAPDTLFSADIYCGEPTGGSATAFAGAMAWLARQAVPVINISLVGPDNALLRRATAAMVERGHVLVSSVGNDGPAAAPLFPAAYAGVIGVTAVDDRARVLPEALRGAQVDFAAQGVRLRAADVEGGWQSVRGTSFAAPLVARAAALLVTRGRGAEVATRLAEVTRDLGEPGRDDIYGFGLVEPRD